MLGVTLGDCSTFSGSRHCNQNELPSGLERMDNSDGVWIGIAVIFLFGAWSLVHSIWNMVKTVFANPMTFGVVNVGASFGAANVGVSVATQTDHFPPTFGKGSSLNTATMWCTAQGNKVHLYNTCQHLKGKATLPSKEGFCQTCLEKFDVK